VHGHARLTEIAGFEWCADDPPTSSTPPIRSLNTEAAMPDLLL